MGFVPATEINGIEFNLGPPPLSWL